MSDAEATPDKSAAGDNAPPPWLDRMMNGPVWALLVVALFALVNYTAARHYRRWDWTSTQRFTLSSRSVEIVRGLREPVELYVLLSSRDPLYAETHELAERYAAASPKVRLHRIDPDRQRERLIALAQELDPHLLDRTAEGRTLATAGILVRRGNRHWEVEREQLHELGPQQQGEEGNDASRLLNAKITVERRMSEALLQVDRERATTLCFSAGHAEMPLASGDRAAAGLADDLRHLNFVVREAEIRGQTGVPADCDALVIAGPQRAWAREDSDAVVRYLRGGGNVAMFLDPVVLEGRVVPTGLEDVVGMAGIGLPPAVIVESDPDHLLPDSPPVHFRADTWNEHEITGDLRGASVLVGMARPVVRAEGSQGATSLLLSSPQAWGETAIAELLRTFVPSKGADDVQGPVSLAMAGMISDGRSRGEGVASGRVVVVGSSEMVGADYFNIRVRASVANANLAEAVIGWITARRELVNIPARPVDRAALMVSGRDLTKIGVYVMLLIPLAAALVGLAVSRARKNIA
jgi:hypothetical protein